MKIVLGYNYTPHTTAVYLENAFRADHEVIYVGSSSQERLGSTLDPRLAAYVRASAFQPDLVLYSDSGGTGGRYFPRDLELMSCPTTCYLIDTHRDFKLRAMYAPFFDYIFVAQRDHVQRFEQLGFDHVSWLPLACDPQIHGPRMRPKTWDIGFVGQVRSPERALRLALLAKRYRVNDYRRSYPKEQITEVYSRSKIVFNTSLSGDLNMRVFEAMASGALLITDHIGNGQDELFQAGTHLIEYDSDEELLELVDYYLAHDDEREQIAHAGCELVLSKHTYSHRCQQMLTTVFSNSGPDLTAQARGWNRKQLVEGYTGIYYKKHATEPLLNMAEELRAQGVGNKPVVLRATTAFLKRLYRALH
jgi:hypothetical protein